MKVRSGCHPFEMMPGAAVAARIAPVSAPYATDGRLHREQPNPSSPAGSASASCAIADADELRAARSELSSPGDYLLYRDGGRLRWAALTRPSTRVGRSLVADLRFEDPTVSRRHALITREPAGMRLLDDRSSYGVFVNGQRVDSRLLCDGDVISLGRNRLLYQRVGRL